MTRSIKEKLPLFFFVFSVGWVGLTFCQAVRQRERAGAAQVYGLNLKRNKANTLACTYWLPPALQAHRDSIAYAHRMLGIINHGREACLGTDLAQARKGCQTQYTGPYYQSAVMVC